MGQIVRRERKKKLGDEVVANEVGGIAIPENQKFTIVREDQNYDEGEPFYYEDSNLESPYRVILFTTGRNLALMEKHNNWYGGKLSNIGHSNPYWTETEKEANDKKNDTKAASHDEEEEHVRINII